MISGAKGWLKRGCAGSIDQLRRAGLDRLRPARRSSSLWRVGPVAPGWGRERGLPDVRRCGPGRGGRPRSLPAYLAEPGSLQPAFCLPQLGLSHCFERGRGRAAARAADDVAIGRRFSASRSDGPEALLERKQQAEQVRQAVLDLPPAAGPCWCCANTRRSAITRLPGHWKSRWAPSCRA